MNSNSRGLSMVELLISLGLMSVVSLSGLKVADYYADAAGQSDSQMGQLKLINDLRLVVTNPDKCLSSMLNTNFSAAQDSKMRLQLNPSTIVSSETNERVPKDYGIEVTGLTMVHKSLLMTLPGGEAVYSAQLRLDSETIKGQRTALPGAPIASMYLKVNASGNISECMLGETPTDSITIGCLALGGTMINGSCQLRLNRLEVMCPEGQYLAGFDRDGHGDCRNLPIPPTTPQPPGPQCAPELQQMGQSFGASPRVFGSASCQVACVGTFGAGSSCNGSCFSGMRGWIFCSNCQNTNTVCR